MMETSDAKLLDGVYVLGMHVMGIVAVQMAVMNKPVVGN